MATEIFMNKNSYIKEKKIKAPALIHLTLAVSAAVALTAGAVFYAKYSKIIKLPVLETVWTSDVGGLALTTEGKNNLYNISPDEKKVRQYEKFTGKKGFEYSTPNNIIWAEWSPKGYVLVMEHGIDGLIKVKGGKKAGKIIFSEYPKGPSGFTVDTKGNIIVSDTGNNRVLKFSPGGERLLYEFKSVKRPAYELKNGPARVFSDSKGYVYALEHGSSMLTVFDSELKPIKKFDVKLKSRISELAVTQDGYIYMNNHGTNGSVVIYSPGGKLAGKFVKDSTRDFKLISPGGITGGKYGDYIFVMTFCTAVFEPVQFD